MQPGKSDEDKRTDSIVMQLTELRSQLGQLIEQKKIVDDQQQPSDEG